eukprot:gene3640-4157_t
MAEKYSGLPSIDAAGKDTFETEGDIKDERSTNTGDLRSDAVDHYKINHKEAFDVFKDRYVDASGLDFSSKIGLEKGTGYDTRTVYEIIGEAVTKESPQQKYQRLQHELQQLSEEVSQISETVQSAEKEAQMSPAILAQEVSQLQKQLQNLHLEKIFGAEALSGDAGSQGNWTRQIASQLESFKAKNSGKDPDNTEHITYELYCRPEHAKFTQSSKISELESRLHSLENVIGKDSQKMAGIIAEPDSSSPTLMDSVKILRTKMSLLDPTNIDIVDSRLQGLLQHILQLTAKKETVENAENQAQVAEIHEMMQKWDGVVDLVPELANRLKALSSLHGQASTFAQSLTHLETTQGQIKDQLQSQKDVLEKVEESFLKNISAIQANCNNLDGRINALLEKMG